MWWQLTRRECVWRRAVDNASLPRQQNASPRRVRGVCVSVAMGDASDDDAAVEPMHLAYPETGAPDSGEMDGDGDGDAAVAPVPASQNLDWLRDLPTQGPSQAADDVDEEPLEGGAPAAEEPLLPVDAAVAPVPESQNLDWLRGLNSQSQAVLGPEEEPLEGAAAAAHTAPVDAPVAGDARALAPAPGAGDPHLQQGDVAQDGVPLGPGVPFPPQAGVLICKTAWGLASPLCAALCVLSDAPHAPGILHQGRG
jgi:hypothetical protein